MMRMSSSYRMHVLPVKSMSTTLLQQEYADLVDFSRLLTYWNKDSQRAIIRATSSNRLNPAALVSRAQEVKEELNLRGQHARRSLSDLSEFKKELTNVEINLNHDLLWCWTNDEETR